MTLAAVTLGDGVRLLPRRITPPPLRLISANMVNKSFVELHYEVRNRE